MVCDQGKLTPDNQGSGSMLHPRPQSGEKEQQIKKEEN